MIFATDVQYDDVKGTALAAGVVFQQWYSPTATMEYVRSYAGPEPYESGQFYKRELPCILPIILVAIDVWKVSVVIVDGYVDLGEGRPGLGRRLYEALDSKIAVVGVAKTRFGIAPAEEVFRGGSVSPLFVTSVGMSLEAAVDGVTRMSGDHRIPTMLKKVDMLARGG